MMKSPVLPIEIQKLQGQHVSVSPDLLAVEEPLEIRLVFGPQSRRVERRLAITMRTPGQDFELALGLLWSENIISSVDEVQAIRYCERVAFEAERGNVLRVHLAPSVEFDLEALQRTFYASASCGICGKAALEGALQCRGREYSPEHPVFSAAWLQTIPGQLREKQSLFSHTGGMHAAALFHVSGQLLRIREDIGRHNAVDKLIGSVIQEGEIVLGECLMWLSGRAGFELIQKAVAAGIPLVAAMGAPSSLAVQLARQSGLTLMGFLRPDRFNLYTDAGRVTWVPTTTETDSPGKR